MKAMGRILPKVTRKSLGKRDVALAGVMAHWGDIMGGELASMAKPYKISWARDKKNGGVLHLQVLGAGALLLQHSTPQILRRLNGYFGYEAIESLRLMQGVMATKKGAIANDFHARTIETRRKKRPLAMGEAAEICAEIAHIEDDNLRAALQKLGEGIRSRKSKDS